MLFTHAIAIVGPTASGKTAVSLELSGLVDAEIISADSRQVYRYLDIGTAKPTPAELNLCPHHYVSIIDPDQSYSAGTFGDAAAQTVEEIFRRDRLPLIAGGSGFYISALCDGLFQEEESDFSEARQQLQERLEREGRDRLYDELRLIDPVSAEKYSDRNPRRILRALEYFYSTGMALSQAHSSRKHSARNFPTLYFGIRHKRPELYARINRRCEIMWNEGLVEETQRILDMGYSPELQSLNTVGYKEIIPYLRGDYGKERALELMQQNTRRYAKRQTTWFARDARIEWFSGSSTEIAQGIAERIKEAHTQ